MLSFAEAYLVLKRGERARAANVLRDLTQRYPSFPDPWIWLSATTHNRAERIDHLENAVVIEPAHPLAREALAIARGRVMPEAKGPLTTGQLRVVQAKCAMCGGGLEYMPGAIAVTCPYCGHALEFDLENVVDAEGTLIGQALSFSELRRTFQVTTVTYQLVLLPMWVGLAHQVHEARLVLVNGQTGRVALSSPLRSGPLD